MTPLRQNIATASSSISGLDAAKLEMAKFRDCGTFAGRECYLEEATRHLNNVIENGQLPDSLQAIPLKVKVNLERARYILGNYRNQSDPFNQEVSLVKACHYLHYAFLNNDGNDRNESVNLQTQVNFERAQLEWLKFKSKTTRPDQELCMQTTSAYLNYIMVNGNADTRQKAVELNASISLEKAKLKWLDYQSQSSSASKKVCLAEAADHLRTTIANGKIGDRHEASKLLNFVRYMMRDALKNETTN